MKDDKENFFNKFRSGKPRNLSEEEERIWDKDQEWERQERERRKKAGYYSKRKSNSSLKEKKGRVKFKRSRRKPSDMRPFHEM